MLKVITFVQTAPAETSNNILVETMSMIIIRGQGHKEDSLDCNTRIDHMIISPNEVFGDIMVLASPRPPVDPDDVNALARKIFNVSLSNFI